MLLPDCGHSYCVQCIEENSTEADFSEERRRQTVIDGASPTGDTAESNDLLVDDNIAADDDLLADGLTDAENARNTG